MKFLLDTNVCIRFLNQRSARLLERFHATDERDIAICSVVKAELYLGALKSQSPEASMAKLHPFVERFRSLPFDDLAAQQYARIRAGLESAGTIIGANDLLIAAIALAHDLTLITHNVREFERVHGLKMTDWEAE